MIIVRRVRRSPAGKLARLMGPVCVLLLASSADACWWKHHCGCHRAAGAYPSYAVQQMPAYAVQPAPVTVWQTPMFYPAVSTVPVALAPVGRSPAAMTKAQPALAHWPQSGLREVIETVKLLRDANLLDRGGSGDTCRSAVSELQATLLDGQADLRGRLINNAGLSRDIGEQVVSSAHRVGANGELVKRLVEINRTLKERLPAALPEPTPAVEESTSSDLEARLRSIEAKLAELAEKLP